MLRASVARASDAVQRLIDSPLSCRDANEDVNPQPLCVATNEEYYRTHLKSSQWALHERYLRKFLPSNHS